LSSEVFAARADQGNEIAAVIEIVAGNVAGTPAANTDCSQVRRDQDARSTAESKSVSKAEFRAKADSISGAKRFEFIWMLRNEDCGA
jgi:hypothetical protein